MTGEKLKEVLLSFKISQTDIAKKIGMSQQSLNQMLGASDVKSGLLEKIANAVNVSVSRLYEMACCAPDNPSLYNRTPVDGVSTEVQRTHNGGTTEEVAFYKEQAEFYKQQASFYKEQLDFYKNRKS